MMVNTLTNPPPYGPVVIKRNIEKMYNSEIETINLVLTTSLFIISTGKIPKPIATSIAPYKNKPSLK